MKKIISIILPMLMPALTAQAQVQVQVNPNDPVIACVKSLPVTRSYKAIIIHNDKKAVQFESGNGAFEVQMIEKSYQKYGTLVVRTENNEIISVDTISAEGLWREDDLGSNREVYAHCRSFSVSNKSAVADFIRRLAGLY